VFSTGVKVVHVFIKKQKKNMDREILFVICEFKATAESQVNLF